ncbi:MAG: carboxypeptidase-like regulatory domain-containing protein, partial [Calditrichota bacterium]
MLKRTLTISVFTLLFFLIAVPGGAEVTVEPQGFAVWFEGNEDDPVEVPVIFTNGGEEDVGFNLRLQPVRREQERRLAGPRRDDPGDVIRELELAHPGILGIARDPENNVMWVTHTLMENGVPNGGMFTCYRINGEEAEVVAEIVPGGVIYPLGGTYHNGVLYATVWQNAYIIRYDLAGNNLGNVNLNGDEFAMGFCVDPERGYLFASVYPTVNIVVLDINDNFARVGVIQNVCGAANLDTRVRLCWVPEHEDGHLWLSLQRPGQDPFTAWQLAIDDEFNWEEVQHFEVDTDVRSFGIGHDGADLWVGRMNEVNVAITDDGIFEPRWLVPDVEEGVIPGGEAIEVNFTVTPVELEDGIYEVRVVINLDDPAQPQIAMTVLMSLNSDVASISGAVTDPARGGEPVEGVLVDLDPYLMMRQTGEDGAYAFENLPLGNYQVTFTAPDYLPHTEDLVWDEAGEFELNVGLLHSDCVLDPDRIATQLQPGMTQEFDLTLSNPGNGPLTFTTERCRIGEANAAPWELRRSYPISEIAGDPRIAGVAFLHDHFYVTGHAAGQHLIYVLDREGNITDRINQLGQSQ